MRQSDQLFFDEFTSPSMKATKFLGFDKTLLEQQSALGNGGSLIVCPMTRVGINLTAASMLLSW